MWDPFRYKLGGRLLNSRMEEFTQRYGVPEDGRYVITRDVGTYAILKEVEAGRGSPHGGVYLQLPALFGGRLARGVRAGDRPPCQKPYRLDEDADRGSADRALPHGRRRSQRAMETEVPGLLVAGEAVGGANGANRLSGNAITEALVFGRRAGRSTAAARAKAMRAPAPPDVTRRSTWLLRRGAPTTQYRRDAGGLPGDHGRRRRTAAHSGQTGARDFAYRPLDAALGARPFGAAAVRSEAARLARSSQMVMVARVVAQAALLRTESRGAHQREDLPGMLPEWRVNQVVRLKDGRIEKSRGCPAAPIEDAAQ